MQSKTQTPKIERPSSREAEALARVLREIESDARGRAASYPRESLVPEGGE